MNKEIFVALELLEREKGISADYMIEKIKAAISSAYKREFKSDPKAETGYDNLNVVIDREKKIFEVYQTKTVVEEVTDPVLEISKEDAKKVSRKAKLGDVIDVPIKAANFHRLSAQNAKQVIIQGIREAERGNQIKEYESKKEEIISAVVYRVDPATGNIVLDTGTSYATLLHSEQIPGEDLREGDHIKVFVLEVIKDKNSGPIVTLSRSHPDMVKRLFELEVPEIQEGTVIIKGVTREAGSRSKMAVYSRDENVDPVGACIGSRGIRIADIVDELEGEKIDIIRYSDVPEDYIRSALSPARVNEVVLTGERSARVTVDPDQLSLAIGKEGQNARLAAKLTGFKIDIKVG